MNFTKNNHHELMEKINNTLDAIARISPKFVEAFHAGYDDLLNEVHSSVRPIPTFRAFDTAVKCLDMVQHTNLSMLRYIEDN